MDSVQQLKVKLQRDHGEHIRVLFMYKHDTRTWRHVYRPHLQEDTFRDAPLTEHRLFGFFLSFSFCFLLKGTESLNSFIFFIIINILAGRVCINVLLILTLIIRWRQINTYH